MCVCLCVCVCVQIDQLYNATCGCGSVPINATSTWLSTGLLLNAFNNTQGGITDWPTYAALVCTPRFGAGGACVSVADTEPTYAGLYNIRCHPVHITP